jgi:predicted dehydrogenase
MNMSNLNRKLQVGIIGLGVGQSHAEAYSKDDRCEVAALCDLSNGRLKDVGKDYPKAILTNDSIELLSNPALDIISIATFDDCHFEQTCLALKHGKHVFVEKPLCRTTEELKKIKEFWATHSGRLKLGCNLILRAAPLYQWIKKEIASGAWGKIYAVDGEYLYGRLTKITEGWRKEVPDYSVIQGGGIHMVDLMLWMTGERLVDVSAMGNRICSENTAFRYNDYVTSIMRSSSGMIARLTANFGCVLRHQHVLRIFGTKATFIYDDAGARFYNSRDQDIQPIVITAPPLPTGKGDLIPEFVSSVINDTDVSDDFQLICDGISACIACDNAVKTNQREVINYV